MITPDSAVVAVASVWQFYRCSLKQKTFGFSTSIWDGAGLCPDGSQAAMVKFNSDYTRALFL